MFFSFAKIIIIRQPLMYYTTAGHRILSLDMSILPKNCMIIGYFYIGFKLMTVQVLLPRNYT